MLCARLARLNLSVSALALSASVLHAQPRLPPAPLSRQAIAALQDQPELLRSLMHPVAIGAGLVTPQPEQADNPWQALQNPPPFSPGAMLQLGDGTVLVQDSATDAGGGSKWWRFRPDASGGYLGGTWSPAASMQDGYDPLYYASGLLPDGRVLVEGGEYNGNQSVWSGQGAIYDPVADHWTAVAPPAGMGQTSSIGDAEGVVLANGIFMLSPVYIPPSGAQQLFNAKTLTWTATGRGKQGGNDEESQVLLPDGGVLTVDVNPAVTDNSELFDPASGAWKSGGSTIVQLWNAKLGEIGPHLLRPDGTVFAIGATGHNAVYNTQTRAWSAAPDFPIIGGKQFSVADGPAAVLPSGRVIVMASPAYAKPSHFFSFDGTTLTQITDPAGTAQIPSFAGYMLVLPTGQVLYNDRNGHMDIFTESAAPASGAAPVITSVPTKLNAGKTYRVSGTQLSGVTQGAAYGDDYQCATNFPLVRLANTATGHVFYARTFGDTKPGVGHGRPSSASFQLPASTETGAASLSVVANGIASAPMTVSVSP